MSFIIAKRGFLLPFLSGWVLLTQYWIPEALILCIIMNMTALIFLAVDYFLLPEPECIEADRILPKQFVLKVSEQIKIQLNYNIPIPLNISILDSPPISFQFDNNEFNLRLKRGKDICFFTYSVKPQQRGVFNFSHVGIRISSPLKFLHRQYKVLIPQEVKVYPQVQSEKEGLQSQFYISRMETRQYKSYGAGREFSQLREYKRGDDIRAIDWKRSAKDNQWVVKEFEPEMGQNLFIILDGGRLMNGETGGYSKADWAVAATLALTQEALNKKDRVGVLTFSNRINSYVLPSNKKPQMASILHSIYNFQPNFMEPNYKAAFEWIQTNLKHKSILVFFTDFVDSFLSSELVLYIQQLKRKHRLICCAMGHNQMREISQEESLSLSEATYKAVIREALDNRKNVLKDLRKGQIDVIDLAPEQICGSLLTSYAKARWS